MNLPALSFDVFFSGGERNMADDGDERVT